MTASSSTDPRRLRVDQVGSLLRPPELKDAFQNRTNGLITEEALRQVQDRAIREVVATQEAHHLPVITDGEFRRQNFQASFGEITGWDAWVNSMIAYADPGGPKPLQRGFSPASVRKAVNGRIQLVRNRALEDFLFVRGLINRLAKVTLLSTDQISQTFDAENSRAFYADVEDFLSDVIAINRQIIAGLADAGCRYIQIDAPGYTAYVDQPSLERMRARGEDPQVNLERSIRADNAVIAGFSDVTFGLHVCRGNRQSMWHHEGAYDAIAERLFSGLDHERLLVEYDTERAGTFEPLRFVPKDKTVVLGLITTKVGRVETVAELQRRIDEASRYVPVERLALSPQCGFASNIAGNVLSADAQWRKLDVMLETAARIWG